MAAEGLIRCSKAVKLWKLGDEEALKHKARAEARPGPRRSMWG